MNHAPGADGRLRAYVLLTLTAMCWGGNAVFGQLAVGQVSPMMLVTLRWLGMGGGEGNPLMEMLFRVRILYILIEPARGAFE